MKKNGKGERMAELQWKIDGIRFKSQEEYQAALRDKELIDSITDNLDLKNPKDVEKLYMELKKGKYEFESIAGRQFDDNIYELYKEIKEKERQKAEAAKAQKEKRRQEIAKVKSILTGQNIRYKKTPRNNEQQVRLEDFDEEMQKEILLALKRRELKRKIVTVACVVLCIVSFGYLGAYYQVSAKSANEFRELAALKEAGLQNAMSGSREVTIHYTKDETKTPDILPEYELVHNKNQKLIGWIKIDDTIIDYPVMQTVNNEYYLDHNFNQEEDRNGCIFMDYQCDVIKGNDNIILYGHHMKSGKMFGTLSKYSQQSYYEEHPIIQFDTIYEKGTYQVMYVFRSKVYSEEEVNFKYYQFFDATSSKEFDSYMNEMAKLSLYDTGVTARYGDQLLTLSTCDYKEKEGRFVVVAKRIDNP